MDVVYIPTMSRYGNLAKIIPLWLKQGFQVRLVVEASEFRKHVTFRDRDWAKSEVRVIPVPGGRGVGRARQFCVLHAHETGLRSLIMSDDDMRPARDSNMSLLLDAATDPGVLGIGAVRSIHDRFTGGAVSANSGAILCPGGWGFQLFALNVQNTLKVGNFDPRLHSYGEDGELARQGIALRIPWQVHCDVKCAAIGKRYEPGGINARFAQPEYRTQAEVQCLAIIHDRWPEYTNAPDKPLRVAWQKMLDHYIPDWRERSAIHGGHL